MHDRSDDFAGDALTSARVFRTEHPAVRAVAILRAADDKVAYTRPHGFVRGGLGAGGEQSHSSHTGDQVNCDTDGPMTVDLRIAVRCANEHPKIDQVGL